MGRLGDRALELFAELCELSSEVQARRLEEIGVEDPELRADVEELLQGDRLFDERLEEKARVRPSLLSAERRQDRAGEALRIVERLVSRTRPFEHYRIEGEVARGGMGQVLEVWDEDLERRLAMKVIANERTSAGPDSIPGDSGAMARFLDEARVTSQLDHPGIVPVHELGLDSEGRVYFTMKLVRGRTLQEVFDLVGQAKEGWSQTRALGVLLKVCEALAYAHSKDVVHRDLKPANVMVGRFGEVYVMDWGVARVRGKADVRDLRPRRRMSSAGETGVLALDSHVETMDGTVVGTPYYMPPEQAAGRMAEVDARSDVYALGAMLYHLLAGRPPYADPDRNFSPQAVLARVLDGPPRAVPALAREAPLEICAICEKAMARKPADRYADTSALADDLRAYLEHRVVGAYETGALAELRKWVERNKGLAAASAMGMLAVVVGLVASLVLRAQSDRNAKLAGENEQRALTGESLARQEKERADREAEAATKKAGEVLRLSALQDLEDLLSEADALWPAHPENIPAYTGWIGDARRLVTSLPVHRSKRAELQARALPRPVEEHREQALATTLTSDEGLRVAEGELAALGEDGEREARWWNNQLTKLIEGLEELERGLLAEDGTTADHGWSIRKRLAFARSLQSGFGSDGNHARAWSEALPDIHSAYPGLALTPQLGLLPLGLDLDSGLWEFAHLQTGEIPERGTDGKLVLTEATGLVFVLLPGGTFRMGAQKSDPSGANYDPQAGSDEGPVHEVTLSPIFLSKYEMTQGQWLRFAGRNPSQFSPPGGLAPSLLHPVEQLSWNVCAEACRRLGLCLPSEAQWEYGARGGTDTPWWTGSERSSLSGAANLADRAAARGGATWGDINDWPELDDGRAVHAPVNQYAPNPFGLHNVPGNVWEWCLDGGDNDLYGQGPTWDPVVEPTGPVRVYRGGSFDRAAVVARSAARQVGAPESAHDSYGLRPARRITP